MTHAATPTGPARSTSPGRRRAAAHQPTPTRLAMAAALLVLAGLPSTASAQGRHQTVVQSGQAAPGTTANVFMSFGNDLQFNDAGQVAFLGNFGAFGTANNLYRGSGGGLEPIALVGAAAPGTGGGTLSRLHMSRDRGMNSTGQITFSADIAGGSSGRAIFGSGGSFGALSAIAVPGQVAPGTHGGRFSSLQTAPGLNDAGELAFQADVTGGSSTSGLFRWGSNGLAAGVLAGQAAPGGSAGTFSVMNDAAPINNSGQVAFWAAVERPGNPIQSGIFRSQADGSVIGILRQGQPAPGAGLGTYGTVLFSAANDAGQSVFYAGLNGGSSAGGVFISNASGDAVAPVATLGQEAPGTGGATFTFLDVSQPVLNNAGQVLFHARLSGGNDVQGLFSSAGGSGALTALALPGQAAPGAGAGTFETFSSASLNERGVVSFIAILSGVALPPSTPFWFPMGLFLTDGRETLAVQRGGWTMNGKTVQNLSNGVSRANIHGQVAYRAEFTDGSSAIRIFTPELRWRETFGASWDTAEHWTLGTAPASVHDVRIDPATALTVTGPAGRVDVRSLTVGGGVGSATLRLADGTLASDQAVQVAGNGALTGRGTLQANLMNAGRVRTEAGQTLELAGTAHTNAGSMDVQGVMRVRGTLFNQDGAQIGLDGGRLELNDGLRNRGLLQVEAGGGQVFGAIDNLAGGRISFTGDSQAIVHGALQVRSGAELRVAPGSTVQFQGPVDQATGSVFSGGGNKLYNGGLSVGSSPGFGLDAGNVRFGAGNVYLAEIGGTRACTLACDGNPALADLGFDKYVVEGTLILGGTLRLVSWNQMVAQEGDSFDLFDWGTLQGRFDSIDASGLSLAAGTLLDFSRLYTTGEVGVTAVPEPGTWGLMAAGLLGLGLRLRRRPAR